MKRKTPDQLFEIIPEYIQNIFAEAKKKEGVFTEAHVNLIKNFHQALALKSNNHKQKYLQLASNIYIEYQTEQYSAVISDLFDDLLAQINLPANLLAEVAEKVCQRQAQMRADLLSAAVKKAEQGRVSTVSCSRS
jgi:hypothetical protein